MVHTTERLLLRKIKLTDREKVFEGLSHEDVIRHYGVSHKTLEDTQIQMDWFESLEREGTGIWWAICSLDDDTFYGAGGLNSLSEKHRKAEIGLWLLPQYWGKGIMTEAMTQILEYGFEALKLHRIEGFIESENIACKRAVEKLGMRHEGTMRECELKNGRFIDLDIYAKIFNMKQH